MKLTFNIEIDTETGKVSVANVETGEVTDSEIKVTKKKATVKKKKDESSEPQLILEDNKYILNSAAVELMQVEPEDRLCIKYKKVGKKAVPVVGTEEAFGTKGGNKLTKTFTVSCRGKANDELARYGSVFTLSENPDGSGTFILQGDKSEEPVVQDAAIDTEDPDIEKDLTEIGDSVDANDVEELSADDLDSLLTNLD